MPMGAEQDRFVELVKARAKVHGPVVVVDLGDELLHALTGDGRIEVRWEGEDRGIRRPVGRGQWAGPAARDNLLDSL